MEEEKKNEKKEREGNWLVNWMTDNPFYTFILVMTILSNIANICATAMRKD